MDETKLTGTEIAMGVGITIAGFGVAAYVAVQSAQSEYPKTTSKQANLTQCKVRTVS